MPPDHKDRGEALFRRSNNYRNLNDSRQAEADLQTIVECDLDLPMELRLRTSVECNDLAWRYATGPDKERDPKKALPLAQKAIKLTPDLPTWWNTLGVVYYRLGQYPEAMETLQRSLREDGEESAGFDLFFLAMCYARRSEGTKAKDCYERAVQWVQEQEGKLQPGAEGGAEHFPGRGGDPASAAGPAWIPLARSASCFAAVSLSLACHLAESGRRFLPLVPTRTWLLDVAQIGTVVEVAAPQISPPVVGIVQPGRVVAAVTVDVVEVAAAGRRDVINVGILLHQLDWSYR